MSIFNQFISCCSGFSMIQAVDFPAQQNRSVCPVESERVLFYRTNLPWKCWRIFNAGILKRTSKRKSAWVSMNELAKAKSPKSRHDSSQPSMLSIKVNSLHCIGPASMANCVRWEFWSNLVQMCRSLRPISCRRCCWPRPVDIMKSFDFYCNTEPIRITWMLWVAFISSCDSIPFTILNLSFQMGNTALMYAAAGNYPHTCNELLSFNPNIFRTNESEETAYSLALKNNANLSQAVLENYIVSLLTSWAALQPNDTRRDRQSRIYIRIQWNCEMMHVCDEWCATICMCNWRFFPLSILCW